MKAVADEILVRHVQDYWLARIGGASPYANVLEALAPSARERFPTALNLLAGPHRGAIIDVDQQRRVAATLAATSWGVERDVGRAVVQLWNAR